MLEVRQQLVVLGQLLVDGERPAQRPRGGRVVAGDHVGEAAQQLVVGRSRAGASSAGRGRARSRRRPSRSRRPTPRSRRPPPRSPERGPDRGRRPRRQLRGASGSRAAPTRCSTRSATSKASRVREQQRVPGLGDGPVDQAACPVRMRGDPRGHGAGEQVPRARARTSSAELGGTSPRRRGGLVTAATPGPFGRLDQVGDDRLVRFDHRRGPVPGPTVGVLLAGQHGRERGMDAAPLPARSRRRTSRSGPAGAAA